MVSSADNFEQLKRADSVYIPSQFNNDIDEIANALRGTKTLLISDNSLHKHNVMINLIQGDGSGIISFEVNTSILYVVRGMIR